jgi:hypothetical protein
MRGHDVLGVSGVEASVILIGVTLVERPGMRHHVTGRLYSAAVCPRGDACGLPQGGVCRRT